jgi:hypothetical protein
VAHISLSEANRRTGSPALIWWFSDGEVA